MVADPVAHPGLGGGAAGLLDGRRVRVVPGGGDRGEGAGQGDQRLPGAAAHVGDPGAGLQLGGGLRDQRQPLLHEHVLVPLRGEPAGPDPDVAVQALLLRFAATARPSRVLLLATYRTAEAALDPAVSDVVAALESMSPPLVLAGLSSDDVRRLLPATDAAVLADVQRRGDGNPLFVSQVARLLGHGAATVADVPVPAGIRQAVRRQVARLASGPDGDGPPAAAEVLATAAALGPGVDPALVAAVLGVSAGAVAGLCDQATAIGLLRPGQDTGEVYRFGHALIRETLYAELTPQARAQVHGRIAAVLVNAAGRSSAELAYHFLRAAPADGEAAGRAVHYSRLAGQDALTALAWEEAAGHFRRALDMQQRAAQAAPASRCELLLSLAEALTTTGPDPSAARALAEAVQLARHADEPRLLAAAALLNARHIDWNAPSDAAAALLREAAAVLSPGDHALRARTLARLAITLAPEPAAAGAAAEQAVREAREAVARDPAGSGPDGQAAAAALATALVARHHVLWGTQDPGDALAAADEIIAAAQRARLPETELDGRVLRLTHLLEAGDGPAAQRVLPELDRLAGLLGQPLARLMAWSRRSALAALAGDLADAAGLARQAFEAGQAAGLPDAGAVYWGQLYGVWLHAGLPGDDEQWMERELRDLVARSHVSVAHAAALVQLDAAHGATEQARGRLDELAGPGLGTLHPDMVYVWTLTELARGCVTLGAAEHAPRLYQALAPYAGRAAVAAGAVMCSGSTDHYLAGLAALEGDITAADRHYRVAISCHRRLGARPMLAHSLHGHALLLSQRGGAADGPAAAAALAEARAIAAGCGMTRLLAVIDAAGEADHPGPGGLTLTREDAFWVVAYAGERTRLPDSLGLRYLDLLVRQPGRELTAVELVRLAAASPAGPARPEPEPGPTDCTRPRERPPRTSWTHKPGPPTGSGWPTWTTSSPRRRSGTTPSGPAASGPRRTSSSASSPRRPGSVAVPGSSARSPSGPGSTSPGRSGPRSPGSAITARTLPRTSTRPSGPDHAAATPRQSRQPEQFARPRGWRADARPTAEPPPAARPGG